MEICQNWSRSQLGHLDEETNALVVKLSGAFCGFSQLVSQNIAISCFSSYWKFLQGSTLWFGKVLVGKRFGKSLQLAVYLRHVPRLNILCCLKYGSDISILSMPAGWYPLSFTNIDSLSRKWRTGSHQQGFFAIETIFQSAQGLQIKYRVAIPVGCSAGASEHSIFAMYCPRSFLTAGTKYYILYIHH